MMTIMYMHVHIHIHRVLSEKGLMFQLKYSTAQYSTACTKGIERVEKNDFVFVCVISENKGGVNQLNIKLVLHVSYS